MPPTRKLPAALLAASLLLVACGDDDEGEAVGTDSTTIAQDAPAASGEGAYPGITVTGAVGESATFAMDDVEAPTELVAEDLVEGDGDEVPAGATVTVHYSGVFLDGTPFDSSFSRGEPATFPLSQVIPGWTEGIPGMHVGGRRLLVIPSDLAYGPAGRSGIPPDSPLVFIVDLLAIG